MIDVFDIARCVNALLCAALIFGLGVSRWRSRGAHARPLGIAVFAFSAATLYGSAEAILQDAPPGGRPLLILLAAVIANVCVYIPLLQRPRKDTSC